VCRETRVEFISEEIMYRVYSVKINGRTLESRNLKELLARAVSTKRNPEERIMLKAPFYEQESTAVTAGTCAGRDMVAVH